MQSASSNNLVSTTTETSTATSITTIAASTTTTFSSAFQNCLLPLQPSANASFFSSNDAVGTTVTYAPGQQVFYPENLCPQPVSNRTFVFSTILMPKIPGANNYQFALQATANKTFEELANGTTYLYSQPGSGPYSSQTNNEGTYNGNGYWFTLYFLHYSNVTYHWCGITDSLTYNVTAGIEVDYYAPFQQVINGTYGPGTWTLTSITQMSADQIGMEDTCVISGG